MVKTGKETLIETRKVIERGWHDLANLLANDGDCDFARDIERFVERMQPAITERQAIANELEQRARKLRGVDHALSR